MRQPTLRRISGLGCQEPGHLRVISIANSVRVVKTELLTNSPAEFLLLGVVSRSSASLRPRSIFRSTIFCWPGAARRTHMRLVTAAVACLSVARRSCLLGAFTGSGCDGGIGFGRSLFLTIWLRALDFRYRRTPAIASSPVFPRAGSDQRLLRARDRDLQIPLPMPRTKPPKRTVGENASSVAVRFQGYTDTQDGLPAAVHTEQRAQRYKSFEIRYHPVVGRWRFDGIEDAADFGIEFAGFPSVGFRQLARSSSMSHPKPGIQPSRAYIGRRPSCESCAMKRGAQSPPWLAPCGRQSGGMRSPRSKRRYFSAVHAW